MGSNKSNISENNESIIEFDGEKYEWPDSKISGAQLRQLTSPPVPPDRDLFQGTISNPGEKIKDDDTIQIDKFLLVFSKPKSFTIRIDRIEYQWQDEKITGAQLRQLPEGSISSDRDIFQVIPGDSDLLIKDDDSVVVHDGLRFFTAPGTINPGNNRHL